MLPIFLVTVPFFALIAAGYAAARVRILPLEAIPGLNAFVLYFALPCMLYRFGASTPIGQLLDGSVALVWGLCALSLVGLVVAFTRNARIGWNDASFGALVAAFPNTGFMGVPLLTAILGAQSAGPVIITIAFDMVVTSSVCIALSRLDSAGSGGVAQAVRRALTGMLLNPLPWSILLGALASATQYKLPGPIDRTIAMLADAASPAALFTIGAVLARSAMLAHEARGRARVGDVLPVVLVKLLAHPVLVLGVALSARALGLPLGLPACVALVLVAALPSASNVSMLAERFGADNGRIARIILWTTVAAFFSFPLVVEQTARLR
ncbi:AEC family transporter [Variovorax sp. J22R133]|uniref:AEC family transporter n=1 Tax=Variovorax brevis TaxID=3053503 RepID=UPI0025788B10|nr:AEC family transporter [Variovorax sp. J22R133]MDM0117086.1 AEC family transporter [Variovorax sp. J22R133]